MPDVTSILAKIKNHPRIATGAAGAALGGLTGASVSNDENKGKGFLLGAAVGGAAGAAGGKKLKDAIFKAEGATTKSETKAEIVAEKINNNKSILSNDDPKVKKFKDAAKERDALNQQKILEGKKEYHSEKNVLSRRAATGKPLPTDLENKHIVYQMDDAFGVPHTTEVISRKPKLTKQQWEDVQIAKETHRNLGTNSTSIPSEAPGKNLISVRKSKTVAQGFNRPDASTKAYNSGTTDEGAAQYWGEMSQISKKAIPVVRPDASVKPLVQSKAETLSNNLPSTQLIPTNSAPSKPFNEHVGFKQEQIDAAWAQVGHTPGTGPKPPTVTRSERQDVYRQKAQQVSDMWVAHENPGSISTPVVTPPPSASTTITQPSSSAEKLVEQPKSRIKKERQPDQAELNRRQAQSARDKKEYAEKRKVKNSTEFSESAVSEPPKRTFIGGIKRLFGG